MHVLPACGDERLDVALCGKLKMLTLAANGVFGVLERHLAPRGAKASIARRTGPGSPGRVLNTRTMATSSPEAKLVKAEGPFSPAP